jgi:hypothetical protein
MGSGMLTARSRVGSGILAARIWSAQRRLLAMM